jgi:recombination associated protein RdgC
MKTSAFKAFTPYAVEGLHPEAIKNDFDGTELHHWEDDEHMAPFLISDPTGSQWSSRGFTETFNEGDYFRNLDGAGYLCAIEFRDRMLPGSVIREEVDKRAADLFQREGLKPGKKELAQLRDEVEHELLPKSHIRRSVVHILFTGTTMLVFTASAKKCDTIVSFLVGFFNEQGYPISVRSVQPEQNPVGFMTTLALEGSTGHNDADVSFYPTSPMLLKNDTNAVRIKDSNTQRDEYISLIKSGYRVEEMGVLVLDDTGTREERLTFRLTHSFAFKAIKLSDTLMTADLADGGFHAVAWLVAKEYTALLADLLGLMKNEESEDDL